LALESAAGLCLARTHYDVEIEHFLVKLLDSRETDLERIAKHFQVDMSRLGAELTRSLDRLKTGNTRTPSFAPTLMKAFTEAWLYGSIDQNASKIRTGFVVVALLAEDELARLAREISSEFARIDVSSLRREFAAVVRGSVEDGEAAGPVATGSPRVFLSCRRDDSSFYADFLHACLRAEIPGLRISRDTDTLRPGMVYAEKIEETVASCDILLAVIGKEWCAKNDNGVRRIDLTDDWVRLEVAAALRGQKLVIPCLVGGASMPAKEELPGDIAGLALRQGVSLHQQNLRRDAEELIATLKNWRG
jgi:hypothetical protein